MKFALTAITLMAQAGWFALGIAGAEAADDGVSRGRAFVAANCSRCHAINTTGDSPNLNAPPFRQLHLKYPIEALEESLGEGIVTGHEMPEFKLSGPQVGEVVAYLKSLNHSR